MCQLSRKIVEKHEGEIFYTYTYDSGEKKKSENYFKK